jgi:hypothetical protein
MALDDFPPVPSLLAQLEVQVARLRQVVSGLEAQEAHYAEQRQIQAEKLARVEERLAAFRSAAAGLLEVVEPPRPEDDPDAGVYWGPLDHPRLGQMVLRVIADRRADQGPFGATEISHEVNRRFALRMKTPTGPRQIAVVLRRLARERAVRLAQKGKSYSEALFSRA